MKKKARALLLALALCLLVPLPASANGVEPPYLTILVENPPADLQLTLTVVDETSQEEHVLSHDTRLWERYFRFYSHIWSPWAPEGSPQATATLLVETGGESFSLPVEPRGFHYTNNLVTLDLANRRLLYGEPRWRQPLLVCLRVFLTLLLEGLLFYRFGYRRKSSWAVFLVTNLLTQLGVNVAVQALFPVAIDFYNLLVSGIFFYTPLEIAVLLVEMAAFALLLREHRRRRAVGYAAAANLCSWFLGGALLAVLPLLFGTSTLLTIQNAPPGGYARRGVPIFLARERRAKGFPPRNPVAEGCPVSWPRRSKRRWPRCRLSQCRRRRPPPPRRRHRG